MDAVAVGKLFVEIGPLHELDQVSAFDDGESWAVVVAGQVITLELDALRNRLVLSAEVGQPPAGGLARVYEALLQYNLLWRDTSGVRMALDGPGGQVVQMYDLATDGLDASRLGLVVKDFAAVLAGWRELVARGPVAAQAEAAGGTSMYFGGAIRA
jgi:hypothetical protein